MSRIYVSNWSSHKTLGHHGPGRKLTIMPNPRHWERGEGQVGWLCPHMQDLQDVRSGAIDVDEYERRYRKWVGGMLRSASSLGLQDGDTLCCACSREAAAAGRCHRVWAADILLALGFQVVLDGRELVGISAAELEADLNEQVALRVQRGQRAAQAEGEVIEAAKARLRLAVRPFVNEVGMHAAMDAVKHAHGWDETVEALVKLAEGIEALRAREVA